MFKEYNTNQVILPLDLEIILPQNDIVFVINDFIESIPDEAFTAFCHERGPSAYHPRMILKLILCAYSQLVFSGRKIEALIEDSIRMRWLAQGYAPSYRTINRFRVDERIQGILQECFVQFRDLLVGTKQIDTDVIFIDETKIEANANKYTFVWHKSIEKHHQNLNKKSLSVHQELLETEIIPALEREKDGELSKSEIKTVIGQLTQTIGQYDQAIEQEETVAIRKKIRNARKCQKKN